MKHDFVEPASPFFAECFQVHQLLLSNKILNAGVGARKMDVLEIILKAVPEFCCDDEKVATYSLTTVNVSLSGLG